MSDFKIEKCIPAPLSRQPHQYPFDQMEVGDSFLIPGAKITAEVFGSIAHRKNRYGEGYRCRAVDDGLRVWRVK